MLCAPRNSENRRVILPRPATPATSGMGWHLVVVHFQKEKNNRMNCTGKRNFRPGTRMRNNFVARNLLPERGRDRGVAVQQPMAMFGELGRKQTRSNRHDPDSAFPGDNPALFVLLKQPDSHMQTSTDRRSQTLPQLASRFDHVRQAHRSIATYGRPATASCEEETGRAANSDAAITTWETLRSAGASRGTRIPLRSGPLRCFPILPLSPAHFATRGRESGSTHGPIRKSAERPVSRNRISAPFSSGQVSGSGIGSR